MPRKPRRKRPKRISIPGGVAVLARRYRVALTSHHYAMLTQLGYRMDTRSRRPRCFRGKAMALLVTYALEGLQDALLEEPSPLRDADQLSAWNT
jgi:hypothetical protein